MRKHLVILFVLLLLICLFNRGKADKKYCFNSSNIHLLQTGDLALIAGDSHKSNVVRFTNDTKSEYSHIGFVVIEEDGSANIVHMSIDEGCIVWEKLETYIAKSHISGIDFYRLNNDISHSCIYAILDSINNHGKKFDMSFNHEDSEKYYCTELVVEVLKELDYDIQIPNKNKYIYPSEFAKESISHKIY